MLLVADSFLVSDGRVRAFGAHAARFGRACAVYAGISRAESLEFARAAAAQVPSKGRWFPRMELALSDEDPRLELWIRPAPSRTTTVRLWIHHGPDPRSAPSIKGPDLDLLSGLRERAICAGADEAVLVTADGRVLEGATTSLLWWRGDALCAPPEGLDLLDGVTRQLLMDLAAEIGVPVLLEQCFPQELSGLETWAVNALHGIRPIVGWTDPSIKAGAALRASAWSDRLDQMAQPVIHA